MSFVGYEKYDNRLVHFDMDFTNNKAALEDRVIVKLYNEFMSKNRELYEKDPVMYWRQCRRYVESEMRGERFK